MSHSPGEQRLENGWKSRPICPAVGLQVDGPDLTSIDGGDATRLGVLLARHGALLLRDQKLNERDLVEFSKHFGELDEAPINEDGKTVVEGFPEIYVISNILGSDGKPVGSLGAGEATWHTDMSYLDTPPAFSLLYAVEIPQAGGNTWLSGMYSALDKMPEELRNQIEGRRIKHDSTYNSGGYVRQGATANDDPLTCAGTFHPAICIHPQSGRDVLFLGRRRNAYVEGLSLAESDALLDKLWSHATKPEFTYSHTWRVGDVLIWDNRATLHRRDEFDPSERRYMLRTQIKGADKPRGR